jgi:hypothetical protein
VEQNLIYPLLKKRSKTLLSTFKKWSKTLLSTFKKWSKTLLSTFKKAEQNNYTLCVLLHFFKSGVNYILYINK